MAVRIIVSSDLSTREAYLSEFLSNLGIKNPHPDLLYIENDSKLGVEEGKLIRQHLSFKPFSFDRKVVFLISSNKLTPDAQNSLLKTLEEPPIASEIILGVEKLDDLLETVISRCEVIYLDKEQGIPDERQNKSIQEFIEKNTAGRFTQIEKIEDKDIFLEDLIKYFRQKLHQEDQKSVQTVNELLNMQQWIQSNVNSRAILEYAALIIPSKK